MRGISWVLLGLIALLIPQVLAARLENEWVLLKTEHIDAQAEAQTIPIPDEQPRLHAIRLVLVSGKTLELTQVVISYGNGQQHFEDGPIRLNRGEQTHSIGERPEA